MERYIWMHTTQRKPFGGSVVDTETGDTVDLMRTRSGAQHGANMLNLGACHVEPHRPVSCRIVSNFTAAA